MANGTSMVADIRVLILEDDAEVRHLLQAIIAAEDFEVESAGSLEQCRKVMKTFDANLFVIDEGLPDGSGLSLVREIRARGDAGVLMLSGRSAEVDQVLGLELGADDYVTKPFRKRELLARLRAIARRISASPRPAPPRTPQNGPDYQAAEYKLFLDSRRLSDPSGQGVKLTSAEFDVLVALMEMKGKVVSRDQIIASVQRRNWTGNERAIDGIVSRLRRKLPAPDEKTHFIRTVHGIGYMITG